MNYQRGNQRCRPREAGPAARPGRGIGVRPARTIGNKRGRLPPGWSACRSCQPLPTPRWRRPTQRGSGPSLRPRCQTAPGTGQIPRAPRAHAYSTAKKSRRAHCPGSGLDRLIPRQWGLRRSPSVKGQHLVVGRGRGPRRAPASWPSNLSRQAAQDATPALSVSSPTPPAGLRDSRCR